ncbi:MAG: SH3 domain-containing protein [Acidobacteriota bacterium]|nr:SH3 domain-containing protein [Acidobacteriota bacterium]
MLTTKNSLLKSLAAAIVWLLLSQTASAGEGLKIRILGMGAPVRQAPDTTARFILIAQKGQVFEVVEKLENWYLIKLPNSQEGYVHKSVAEELVEVDVPKVETPEKTVAEKAIPVVEKPALIVEEKAEPVVEVPEKMVAEKPKAPPEITIIRPAPSADKIAMLMARFGYFVASDSAFNEIYENGPVFGGELRLGGRKVAGWLEGGYREHKGKFSFTGEKTKVNVIGVELGVLYRLSTGTFQPNVGTGVGYYMFNEKNAPLGEAKENKIGFCGIAGISIIPTKDLVLDLRLKYYTCKMRPADFDIEIGGLSLDLGIGFSF